jgi:hypothetical protein
MNERASVKDRGSPVLFGNEAYLLEDFLAEGFLGTFAPFFRASESPIAIACLRLFTFPPLPPGPDFSVPFFRRRIADSTRLLAAFPYFRLPDDFFRAAITDPPGRVVKRGSSRESPGDRQAVVEIIQTRIGANNQSLGNSEARVRYGMNLRLDHVR